jgi:transcriptional regulator with XRE-family HTH domain
MAANAREGSLPIDVGDEPLIGWRCWHVLPHEGLLRPIYKRGLVWKPRQALEALCPEEPHEVPAENCRCGVWTVCHPMLLDEVGWTTAPPKGIGKLPGIMVVGEVSLWGKIIQHERGWRASCAYPRHLYVFTDDPLIAETLRERYGVPVEWGADAERLRRMLPLKDAEEHAEEEPSLRETLLDVLRTGLCPKPLEELAAAAVDGLPDFLQSPEKRIEKERALLASAATAKDRTDPGWRLAIAAADVRVLQGDPLAARRALWVRLARWQRSRGDDLLEKKIEPEFLRRDELLEDLSRGTARRTNGQPGSRPYAAQTLKAKRDQLEYFEQRIAGLIPEIEQLLAVPIPTYREWCAIARGVVLGSRPPAGRPSEDLGAWHRRAMQREQRLAKFDRELAVQRHQLNVDQAALEERVAALEQQRATLRDDVVAGVERDRADLLREVGELEARRRAALAMLPGPWPPPSVRRPRAKAVSRPVSRSYYPQQQDLKALLKEHGITQATLAGYAGVTRTMVVNLLAGRTASARVQEAAQRLLRVRTRLTELGWSQSDLARRIGKNSGLVSRVLRGQITSAPVWEAIEQVTATEGGRHDTFERKAVLKASGHSYADLARLADVSFSMVFKWMNGDRQSDKIAEAFRRVTKERGDLKALRDRLAARGITLQRIALESEVSPAHVTNVLNGRHVSAPVIDAARRLLGEAP